MVEPHEMTVAESHEAGAEEWSCSSCGRRILLRWPPHHERVVLHRGDDRVVHVGGRRGTPDGAFGDPVAAGPTDPERRWLRDHGIAW